MPCPLQGLDALTIHGADAWRNTGSRSVAIGKAGSKECGIPGGPRSSVSRMRRLHRALRDERQANAEVNQAKKPRPEFVNALASDGGRSLISACLAGDGVHRLPDRGRLGIWVVCRDLLRPLRASWR